MATVNPEFANEIIQYGAKDFKACFNCGTCTAICNLTEKNANFPRIFIRKGILGQKDEILQSKELWLCYACCDCSVNCPRQAAPGEYMAALRRYAIAGYEPTGITKLIFKSNPVSILITLLLAVMLGFFLFTLKPEMEVARWLFKFLPYEIIHTMGLIIFSFTGLTMVWGMGTMILKLQKIAPKDSKIKKPFFKALSAVIAEMAMMKRYRVCDEEEDSFWLKKPLIMRPWAVHWAIMWGFIGLLIATALDFAFKDPATTYWLPSRLLGTIAGILLVYGASMAIIYRRKKITRTYQQTTLADQMLLFFLWIAGITGFWLEVAVFIDADTIVNHIVFVIHTIISMELVLLFAFSKFAHAIYRPIALFFYNKS